MEFISIPSGHRIARNLGQNPQRVRRGLGIANEISVLGETPSVEAAPALLEISKLTLDENERNVFAEACFRVAYSCASTHSDCHRAAGQLVPPLSAMLDRGDSETSHEAAKL